MYYVVLCTEAPVVCPGVVWLTWRFGHRSFIECVRETHLPPSPRGKWEPQLGKTAPLEAPAVTLSIHTPDSTHIT